jgi:hypothetical protein
MKTDAPYIDQMVIRHLRPRWTSPMRRHSWRRRLSGGFAFAYALERQIWKGQSQSGFTPCSSDVALLGYGESFVDLNAEVARRALNLLVSQ